MQTDTKNDKFLPHYFGLTYVLLLINAFRFLTQVDRVGFIAHVFSVAAYLSYCFAYLLPVFLVLRLLQRIVTSLSLRRTFRRVHISPMWIIYTLALFLLFLLQLLTFTDLFVFRLYGFHLNGFVWNLVITPGGIQSMGADTGTMVCFAAIAISFFLVQATLLILWLRVQHFERFCNTVFTKSRTRAVTALLIFFFVFQAITYGFSSFYGYAPVLTASGAFPLYQPVTFSKFAESMGLKAGRKPQGLKIKSGSINLFYPVNKIQREPNHKTYNIVWLVAESLRSDMLDPNIMPQTWNFSQKAVSFRNHYSGGNGTRMGMFAMFYGLYGNYWFSFLHENRGPVLVDLLLEDNYQMDMYTSARFSYPEFDKTIFARLPQGCLHDETENTSGQGWQRDREDVGRLIDFIKNRDTQRAFMTFMFFESPHARYYFPPENAVRTPYLEEFNYATADLHRDIKLIKNRYINSCNHLDSQIARILQYLKQANLMNSTIILITGDHGEEFMEKGRWGHNSSFTEEQTQPPLVLWVPGVEPHQVTHLSSHLDIPATILPLLGVTNPPRDYSLGFNLLGPNPREFAIISDWSTLAYVDNEYKAVFPLMLRGFGKQKVTTKDDTIVPDSSTFYQSRQDRIVQIMKELTYFSKHQ